MKRLVKDGREPGSEVASRGQRILVVEDEPDIAALIGYQLTRAGFRVETTLNGVEALRTVARDIPDLIVLDRMLPGISGDEVLSRLKDDPETQGVPVLVLTAKKEREERIAGLELGADDYLTKPFSPRELVLRVQAILRRTQEPGRVSSGSQVVRVGLIHMDVSAMQVSVAGEDVSLTPTEFRLLRSLLESRERTLSRRQLLEKAWDVEADVSDRFETRTVDMHVQRLRAKLGEAGDSIQTVRGFGYRLKKDLE
ncbi:MAG: DNA-binding response regulator [Gammaproteobacteria bacterium]|nr:MAG: DNA-binding response regulator [Gammaproteobacteria bacterium]